MSRIAFTFPQPSDRHPGADQFGENEGFRQPVDPFETLPTGAISSVLLDSAPISSGDLDAEVRIHDQRWADRRAVAPARLARLRLAMALPRR